MICKNNVLYEKFENSHFIELLILIINNFKNIANRKILHFLHFLLLVNRLMQIQNQTYYLLIFYIIFVFVFVIVNLLKSEENVKLCNTHILPYF